MVLQGLSLIILPHCCIVVGNSDDENENEEEDDDEAKSSDGDDENARDEEEAEEDEEAEEKQKRKSKKKGKTKKRRKKKKVDRLAEITIYGQGWRPGFKPKTNVKKERHEKRVIGKIIAKRKNLKRGDLTVIVEIEGGHCVRMARKDLSSKRITVDVVTKPRGKTKVPSATFATIKKGITGTRMLKASQMIGKKQDKRQIKELEERMISIDLPDINTKVRNQKKKVGFINFHEEIKVCRCYQPRCRWITAGILFSPCTLGCSLYCCCGAHALTLPVLATVKRTVMSEGLFFRKRHTKTCALAQMVPQLAEERPFQYELSFMNSKSNNNGREDFAVFLYYAYKVASIVTMDHFVPSAKLYKDLGKVGKKVMKDMNEDFDPADFIDELDFNLDLDIGLDMIN